MRVARRTPRLLLFSLLPILTAMRLSTGHQNYQTGAPFPQKLDDFLSLKELLLADGGHWESQLPQDDSSGRPVEIYGYRYEAGINERTLRLKIVGFDPKKTTTVLYWEGYYTWNPVKRRIIYFSVDATGRIAIGEAVKLSSTSISLIFKISNPDGSEQTHKDDETFSNGILQTVGSELVLNKWVQRNRLTYRRLVSENKDSGKKQ